MISLTLGIKEHNSVWCGWLVALASIGGYWQWL